MRIARLFASLALSTLCSTAFAGSIIGVFQGTVVQLPAPKAKTTARWMYVQGKNGAIRRANIAKARIDYDDDYPKAKRHKNAEESLIKASVVRVTAEQDSAKDGEWQATNVLLVAPPGAQKPSVKPSGVTPVLSRRAGLRPKIAVTTPSDMASK